MNSFPVLFCMAVAWTSVSPNILALEPEKPGDKAAEILERAGAWITRDEKRPAQPIVEVELALSPNHNSKTLPILADLPELKVLTVTYGNTGPAKGFGDEEIRSLGKLKQLRELRLQGLHVAVSDDGWRPLANLANVETLHLNIGNYSSSKINNLDSALKSAAAMPSVRTLVMSSRGLRRSGAQSLLRFPRLENLKIRGDRTADEVLEIVGRIEKLRTLQIIGEIENNGRSLSHFGTLRRLRVLEVGGGLRMVLDDLLTSVEKMEEIETLVLSGQATDRGWRGLGSAAKLKRLELRCPDLSESCVEQISRLRDLAFLKIAFYEMSGCDALARHGLPSKIETCEMYGEWKVEWMTEGVLTQLLRLESLQSLTLAFVRVSDAQLGQIAKMQRLTHLTLRYVGVTDSTIPFLSSAKGLQHLDLCSAVISAAGIAELRRSLPKCKVVSRRHP